MQSNKRAIVKHTGLFLIAVMLAVFWVFNSNVGMLTKIEDAFFVQQSGYVEEIQAQFHISDEPSVLYLDAGVAPYYLQANSSGRYICPLPLQRDSPEWDLTDNYAFQQTYREALDYNGTYIIWDGSVGYNDWIHSGYENRKPLLDKLDREYEIVWTKGWVIYKRE
jgi:hypothetical protein